MKRNALLFPARILFSMALLLFAHTVTAATIQYTYDDAGRLTMADYGISKRIAYGYDDNGNLLTRITVGEIVRGDVNIDGMVNLKDALVTLRILSGQSSPDSGIADYISTKQDVIDVLGMPEVLFILQYIAEMR